MYVETEMQMKGKLYIEQKRHAQYSDLTPSDKVKTSSPGVRPEKPRHAGQLHNSLDGILAKMSNLSIHKKGIKLTTE